MNEYLIGKRLGDSIEIGVLRALTLNSCYRDVDYIVFVTGDGLTFTLGDSDCTIEDVCGELEHLAGAPITLAGESASTTDDGRIDREAWCFYQFATVKGYVTIRFYGCDGYYACFAKLEWTDDRFDHYVVDDYEPSYDGTKIYKLSRKRAGQSLEHCRARLKSEADEDVAACEKNIKELAQRIERAEADIRRIKTMELPALIAKAATTGRVPVVDRS